MRKLIFATVVSLVAFAPVLAAPAQAATSAAAEVSAAVDGFRKAMMAADGRRLTAMASPSLRFGHSNGMVQSRAEFVRSVATRQEIFRNIVLTDRKVSVTGNTAVARHTFHADILYEGKPLLVSLASIEVWAKQGGRWVLTARQAFTPKPPAQVAANPARPKAAIAAGKAKPATRVAKAKGSAVVLSGKLPR